MAEHPPKVSLMGRPLGEANPRYVAEAAELETLKQEAQGTQGQEDPNATPQEQKPEHNWEKRYKDLQSYHTKTTNQLKTENEQLKTSGVPAQFVPPKTAEEMQAFRADKPELYAFVQTIANDIADSKLQGMDQQLQTVSSDLMNTRIREAAQAIQVAHPDWEQIRDSEQFHQWGQAQDDVIQGWLYDNPDNAQNAIRAISLFKSDTGWGVQTQTQSAPQESAAQAVNVQGQSGLPHETDRNHPAYVWKDSEIAKMRPEEYGKWKDVIQLAYHEGRYAQGL